MDMGKEKKLKLFIGCSIRAEWPQEFPVGNILSVDNRHMTLVFLGNVNEINIALLNKLPKPTFDQQPSGIFDKILALPKRSPRAIAYHANFINEGTSLLDYQHRASTWLRDKHFDIDTRPFLPHVTISRPPFRPSQWKHQFKPFQFTISGIHLFQSLGNRQYQILFSYM